MRMKPIQHNNWLVISQLGEVRSQGPRFLCAVFCLIHKMQREDTAFFPIQSHDEGWQSALYTKAQAREQRESPDPRLSAYIACSQPEFSPNGTETPTVSISDKVPWVIVLILSSSPRHDHHSYPRASLACLQRQPVRHTKCSHPGNIQWEKLQMVSLQRLCEPSLQLVSPNENLKTEI